MNALKKLKIKKYDGYSFIDMEDNVIEEVSVSLNINNETTLFLNSSPININELIVGHLFTSGIILSYKDILDIKITEGDKIINADIKIDKRIPSLKKTGTTSGTIASTIFKGMEDKREELILELPFILSLTDLFIEEDTLFKKTGGTHSVALLSQNQVLVRMEDIGRHNALDKVIGHALINEINLKTSMVLLSGRIASEMLLKAMRAGVTAVISKSAPTVLSTKLAKENNVTVIGFLRNGKFNLYNLSSDHTFRTQNN